MCAQNFFYKNKPAHTASRQRPPISYQPAIIPGMTIPFRGRELTLCVSFSRRKPAVIPDDASLQINFYQDAPQPPLADVLHRWYLQEARRCLKIQTARWAAAMGQPYGRITIKDQRSRWGSCSSLRNLNYNWRLIMAPDPVLNYVVIHEVAHLIELNHSPAFWRIVRTYDFDYQKHKLWLRQNGIRLFQLFPTV